MTQTIQPFNSLPVEEGEVVVFSQSNGTFHRSFDPAYAATDQAAYFYVKPSFRSCRWLRIPYTKVLAVTVEPLPQQNGSVVLFAALAIGTFLLALPLNEYSTKALLPSAGFLYFAYLAHRANHGRTRLILKLEAGYHEVRTPSDGYADEKIHDEKLLREFCTAIQTQRALTARLAPQSI